MSRLKSIYDTLPPSLQNAAISLQARFWWSGRFGDAYEKESRFLRESQTWHAEQFREWQLKQLNSLLAEACANVPHYRQSLGANCHLTSLGELSSLPMLEKETFRVQANQLVNREQLRHGAFTRSTSGSTGSPVTFRYDKISMQKSFAFRHRQYDWAGVAPLEPSARFSGRTILGKHHRAPFWRYNATERQWLASVYHMGEENLPLYFEHFVKQRISFFDGYPSALFAFARWMVEHGKVGEIKLKAVITTAEMLSPQQRSVIETAFGCKVFDFYSSSEGAPYITQCEHGAQHINPESGIIEFLRPDGTPAQAGENAEMVVTSFFQRTIPLIRYRIGDMAKLSAATKCACGREMPMIEGLNCRLHDAVGDAGIGVSGLTTALYCAANAVREAQIAEIAPQQFELRYVPVRGVFSEKHLSKITKELHARLGENTEIRAVELDYIPRGANGKFRSVVREWKSADAAPPVAATVTQPSS